MKMAELDKLFEQLNVKPRSITVKIERAIRAHPTYWEARVRETAKGGIVFDRVVYDEEICEGHVIFARINEEVEKREVTNIHFSRVDYVEFPFKYQLRAFNQVTIVFQEPYKHQSPSLEITKTPVEETKKTADNLMSYLKDEDEDLISKMKMKMKTNMKIKATEDSHYEMYRTIG